MKYEIINEKLMINQDADLDKIKNQTDNLHNSFEKFYDDFAKNAMYANDENNYRANEIQGEISKKWAEFDKIMNDHQNKESPFDNSRHNYFVDKISKNMRESGVPMAHYPAEWWVHSSGLSKYLSSFKSEFLKHLQTIHENDYKALVYEQYGATPRLKQMLNVSQQTICEWLRIYLMLATTWRYSYEAYIINKLAFNSVYRHSDDESFSLPENDIEIIKQIINQQGQFFEPYKLLVKARFNPYFNSKSSGDDLVSAITKLKNLEHDRGNIISIAINEDDDNLKRRFDHISMLNEKSIKREAIKDIQDYTEKTYSF